MKTSPQLALTVGRTDDQNGSSFYWEVTASTRDAAGIPKLAEIALSGGYATYGEALLAGNNAWRRLARTRLDQGRAAVRWARISAFLRAGPKPAPLPTSGQRSASRLPVAQAIPG
jgi:hypothetical protein